MSTITKEDKMSESELISTICTLLAIHDARPGFLWCRTHYHKGGTRKNYPMIGWPDFIVKYRGKTWNIETKDRTKLSNKQAIIKSKLELNGEKYCVVKNIESFILVMEDIIDKKY
jgi:hypothetical protein